MKQPITTQAEPASIQERRHKHQQIFSATLLLTIPLGLAVLWGTVLGLLPVWWLLYLPLLGLVLVGVWERRRALASRYEVWLVALLCANGAALNIYRWLGQDGLGLFGEQSLLLIVAGIFLFQRPRWVLATTLPYAALHLSVSVAIAARDPSPERWITLLMLVTTLLLFCMLYRYRQWWEEAHETQRVYHKLAYTDDLTTLPNRRALQDFWQVQPVPGPDTAVVMMVDIDHFKQVNDQYGHAEGDRLLWLVGQIIQRQLSSSSRPPPLVGRWGGEEFLVLLPVTTPQSASELAEIIRASVEQAKVGVSLTVSVGAAFRKGDEELASTAARADVALYRAKLAGRNRVMLYDESEHDDAGPPEDGGGSDEFYPSELVPEELRLF
ncbi:GGDEF domain-containing protein [Deinococcus alpinitundrae]|uniref:GGDEF domain-containing protein n=1 Tax=Deinococcus alpinitundrae TaxID=468913 RepID=UPI00137B2493|nr:GGDEF domain-containing protein [Deinococcus alpinitundrae]